MSTPQIAYSYERVSSAQQVSGRGLGRQSDAAQRWAQQHGLTLDTTLQLSDRGRSASKGHHLTKGALGRFLKLAQEQRLGPSPVLLVEAIDRLSRQEPLDAIETILTGLVGSGCRIITLEDGAEYSRETLRSDPTKLLVLVVKMQAAYEYSARLGRRIKDSWSNHRQRLQQQVMARPRHFCPGWCDWTPELGYVVNEDKAAVVRLVFELLLHQGASSTARDLNARGFTTPSGKAWTLSSVRNLAVNCDTVFGSLRLNQKRHHGPDAQELVIEGMLPVVVDKETVLAVRERMRQRSQVSENPGPTGTMTWIGQTLSWCACGYRMGIMTSGRPPKRHKYLSCRRKHSELGGCERGNVSVPVATAHLLRRLEPEQLETLVNAAQQSNKAEEQQQRISRLQQVCSDLQRQKRNTAAAMKQAARSGVDLSPLLQAQREVERELAEAEQQLAAAQQQLQQLSAVNARAKKPVEVFRQAFATGTDTAEQRQAVNRALKAMGLRIVVDGDQQQMGLELPGGELQWQPIRPLDRRLLWSGRRLEEEGGLVQGR
jgi:DNA invertase Pin-like site-specific DNA recombinase